MALLFTLAYFKGIEHAEKNPALSRTFQEVWGACDNYVDENNITDYTKHRHGEDQCQSYHLYDR